MELIKNLTATFLFFLVGCTSNPFWEDKPSKKVKIEGYVFANERVSDAFVFVYVEELNVYEIAEILEVSSGRVSQIKKSAVTRLRNFIQENFEQDMQA